MSIQIEKVRNSAYNSPRGESMIENLNDVLSAILIVVCLVFAFTMNFSLVMRHRKKKIIQEEIEYYKEW